MSTKKVLAAAGALALGLSPTAALSHTNSIGYVGDGSGGVTFWYGSWHSGTTFNEGELKLEGANGTTFTPVITQFTLLENSTPAGLIPGTNYFQSDGTTLQPYADGANGVGGWSASYTWQGVTFTGLAAGDYTFTYIPLGDPQSYQPNGYPTADWAPYDSVTLSSTISLSSAILSGDANQNGIPDVQEFGTVQQPSTPTLVSSALSYLVTASVAAPTFTSNTVITHTSSENDGVQTINQDSATTVIATTVTTTTTTPVTTDTYSDGSTHAHQGTPVVTTSSSSQSSTSHVYTDYFGRIDQYEVLESIGGLGSGLQGLLNHEPTEPTTDKVRVFSKNYYAWSSADNGYSAKSFIYGGGLEIDIKPTWTIGAQYNNVDIDLDGVDSTSSLNKSHIGVFNMFRGNTLSLLTNAGLAQNKYNVSRNVQGVFNNESSTSGQEWWVNNRLFWHAHKNITPFVGYAVGNTHRDAFTESGSIQSARSVAAVDETSHTGEVGLNLSHRFGGKKKDLFGVSVEGSYATDNSAEVSATVDYKEMVFIQGIHQIADGVSNTAVSANVKFRF
jgi:hypothetical protein